ncbi:MAG: orotidine-5'-phosphate decarboxylase [Calditrichaeota bacterium]|nr:MAG: orotidine-5'-phosphate decarboxylase [Calditrichota bacterium]
MKFLEKLKNSISTNKSNVCVGLDVDLEKFPKHILETDDPIFEFNKAIIDATKDFVGAYKPNSAFYEAYGIKGLESLKKTIDYIPKHIFTILDAKRGDIGNTSRMYAKSAFYEFGFDAITVSPFMGSDSVSPFLEDEKHGIFMLCLTSNKGSQDFQKVESGENLYLKVARKSKEWNNLKNIGLVVGATHNKEFEEIREATDGMPYLIPGIGAQGGSLEFAVKYGGKISLINSSRGIIYASNGKDFAEVAAEKTKELRGQINEILG